jgi:hypothetical protein
MPILDRIGQVCAYSAPGAFDRLRDSKNAFGAMLRVDVSGLVAWIRAGHLDR